MIANRNTGDSNNGSLLTSRSGLLLGLLVLMGLAVAIALKNDLTLLLFSALSVLIVGFLSFKFTKQAILLFILLKPIIDTAWEFELPILGLSPLEVSGVFIPIIILIAAITRNERLSSGFGFYLAVALILINLLSMTRDLLYYGNFSMTVSLLFKTLNGFSVYLVFPFFFKDEKDIRQLFVAFIFAGIFPLATGIYQYIVGEASGLGVRGSGDLARITGFYHDSTNFRFYMIQSIISVLYYLGSFKLEGLKKLFMLAFFAGCLFLVYQLYSKAGFAIIFVGGFLWYFLRGRTLFAVGLALFLMSSYFVFDFVKEDIDELLRYEIQYSSDELNEELKYTLLRGRVGIWEQYLNFFGSVSPFRQFFGVRARGVAFHNDFLRYLISHGILGLIMYLLFLGRIFIRLVQVYLSTRSTLSVIALIVFSALMIDSLGLTPTLYPGYQIFTFGIIAVAVNRNLTERQATKVANPAISRTTA